MKQYRILKEGRGKKDKGTCVKSDHYINKLMQYTAIFITIFRRKVEIFNFIFAQNLTLRVLFTTTLLRLLQQVPTINLLEQSSLCP